MTADLHAVFPAPVVPGDTIQDYRGSYWTYVRPIAPSDLTGEKIVGRVQVQHVATDEKREFYDVVFPGLVVLGTIEVSDAEGESR
jgi:hypothetical protein